MISVTYMCIGSSFTIILYYNIIVVDMGCHHVLCGATVWAELGGEWSSFEVQLEGPCVQCCEHRSSRGQGGDCDRLH